MAVPAAAAAAAGSWVVAVPGHGEALHWGAAGGLAGLAAASVLWRAEDPRRGIFPPWVPAAASTFILVHTAALILDLRRISGAVFWLQDEGFALKVVIGCVGALSSAAVGALLHLYGRLHSANRGLGRRFERRSRELLETNALLRRSNAELEQFAYVASHDLQEPLRMVASYVQLLRRRYAGRFDAEADEFIGFAVDGAKRMQALIQDLLVYSRAADREASIETVSAERACDEALEALALAVKESGANVKRGRLPAVRANRVQVSQLFQNLIGNAIKFRGERRPEIGVEGRRARGMAEFVVRDNGIGFDESDSGKLFRVFQRLHTLDRYEGTGIGLAICRRIVERAGGRIWVESKPGEGSTFRFTLPAAAEERAS